MAIDDLEWLGTWYQQQCNGTWEHQKGMLLEPLPPIESSTRGPGEPGWRLRIDLRGTAASGHAPRRMSVCSFEGAWLRCALSGQHFEGEGLDVERLVGVFRRWIDREPPVLGAASAG
ncbi:Imm53 family immunity protein [Acidipila sp. EB88]|uniref:Imm53 family immunity protein n=1 Tax=Acidipila sp. EB88 TaxID=2305226 RepID=UPI00131586BB|nr:Imm53 family immunity protein [Acidipila sp. EB88]